MTILVTKKIAVNCWGLGKLSKVRHLIGTWKKRREGEEVTKKTPVPAGGYRFLPVREAAGGERRDGGRRR